MDIEDHYSSGRVVPILPFYYTACTDKLQAAATSKLSYDYLFDIRGLPCSNYKLTQIIDQSLL